MGGKKYFCPYCNYEFKNTSLIENNEEFTTNCPNCNILLVVENKIINIFDDVFLKEII